MNLAWSIKAYVLIKLTKGFELDRVIRRMKKKFPEANEKSINLWYRMAKRNINGKN